MEKSNRVNYAIKIRLPQVFRFVCRVFLEGCSVVKGAVGASKVEEVL